MNELLCEVLSICHKISANSASDVFFQYMPHCDAFCVKVHPQGWKSGDSGIMITDCVESITPENLKGAILKFKALALFLEVKL